MISLASFALVKAAHSYQVGKSSFLTYASSCITNEIFMYFRSNKKYQRNLSLYQSLDEDNPEFILEDTLTSDFDLEEIFVHSSDIAVIRNLLNSLTDRERVIVMLYYGFYNDQQYTHSAIAGILGVSQSYVSKLHARIISKLRKKYDFQKYGSKGDVSTIYEIFSAYSVEFVDYAISMLNENDTQIIYIRYGKDLHHPVRYFNWDCEWEVLFTRVLLNIQKNLDKYTNRKNFVLQKRGSVYDET